MLRSGEGFDTLHTFEKVIANIAAKCEFNYGAMGRVGFLYESIKDQLRWNNLIVKDYVKMVSQIGQILSMSDEDYNKRKVEHIEMSDNAIADIFLKAFGDGK